MPFLRVKSFDQHIAQYLDEKLNYLGTGSTFTAISVDDIKNIFILYYSLTEQQQIVYYLDQQTYHIDTLISKSEKIP